MDISGYDTAIFIPAKKRKDNILAFAQISFYELEVITFVIKGFAIKLKILKEQEII